MLGAAILFLAFQGKTLTVETLPQRLKAAKSDDDRRALAQDVRNWFGKSIASGSETKSHDTTVVFAVESEDVPEVHAETFASKMDRIKGTNVWVAVHKCLDGEGFNYTIEAARRDLGGGFVEVYDAEPDTKPTPGIPKGALVQMPRHTSAIFKGATREWWVYTPPGLAPSEAAALMVFQDGQGPKDWVPTVFDNLIAKGTMPKTVAVFLPPGTLPDAKSDRSFEYDTLSDAYVRFLTEEILPIVEKDRPLRKDPAHRAICGISSGGICAFTAAWNRPDAFGKVLSCIGSFTDIASGPTLIAGGHNYPPLIRKSEAKPIRVFLQDGSHDLDNVHGNWPLANQSMAAALKFKGYDYRFDYGQGNHSDRYERAKMPGILTWLWRP